jgi:hypothetical protein
MEFVATNLPHNISHGLYHEKGYDLAETHIDKIFYVLFYGAANLLKDNKTKEAPTTFVINELNGKAIAGATVEYFEDGNNWSLVWTLDPDEIPENAVKLDLQNDLTHSYFRTVSGEKFGMKFHDRTTLVTLLTYSVEQLYKWLDENAKEGSTVEIELDGVFKATVEVVDGKKVIAIDPAGEVKTIIKDDSGIEK